MQFTCQSVLVFLFTVFFLYNQWCYYLFFCLPLLITMRHLTNWSQVLLFPGNLGHMKTFASQRHFTILTFNLLLHNACRLIIYLAPTSCGSISRNELQGVKTFLYNDVTRPLASRLQLHSEFKERFLSLQLSVQQYHINCCIINKHNTDKTD